MNTLKFTKMHGLGNDFMVVDGITQSFNPSKTSIKQWADRQFGIGFDQLLLVEAATSAANDFKYRIFNADGSEVEQCGNGARCFFRFVIDKGLTTKTQLKIETKKGVIEPSLAPNGLITVNMGLPRLAPAAIPFVPVVALAADALTHTLSLAGGESIALCTVNMGNPHAVVLVDDVATAPVDRLGAEIERHDQFPERVNVGFMQVLDAASIRLRVFERGVGETLACGTGACAAVVAGIRLGLLNSTVLVHLPGGNLTISWAPGQAVMMTGPATTVFEGEIVIHE
ncbi:MAG: diaminopimelate epimerase [Neisseriaceae bacterium]|nr:diaminopimelate epimerase [Neisseriaceae bacterium]MBP6861591.1 diaminopimelate epimerase [Neisseriaceae bacterium]